MSDAEGKTWFEPNDIDIQSSELDGYTVSLSSDDGSAAIAIGADDFTGMLAEALSPEDIAKLVRLRALPADHLPGAERHGGDKPVITGRE